MNNIHYSFKAFSLICFLMMSLTDITYAQDIKKNIPGNAFKETLHNELRDESGNYLFPGEEDAIQNSVFSGNSPLSKFGFSISSAGDVNADGYDDIIVGEPDYLFSKGRAFIYFGGLEINTSPDIIFSGENSQDFFGSSVSGAGDLNNDGYNDVVIGAYGNNFNTGKAYIYFGSNSMDSTADVILTGEDTYSNFGVSVSNAGDVNNDGYEDLIIGADSYNGYTGRAYLYYGGMSIDNISDVQFTGIIYSTSFGHSVSGAGDVNGDNFDDIIIGAYGVSLGSGSADIYFGSSSMDNTSDVSISGIFHSAFGRSVSCAGDVNGDGFDDVVVGQDYYGNNTGSAKIYLGSASMNNNPDIILNGENSTDKFGWSVSGAGDINGDGFDDVISGAPDFSGGKGKIYVYYGAASMDPYSDITKTGTTSSGYFGYSVSEAGDFNKDGFSDIIAGAYGMNISMGKVYFYQYRTDPPRTVSDLTLSAEPGSGFGIISSDAGDVNGDGYSDFITSTVYGTGKVFIYFGSMNMDNVPDFSKSGAYGFGQCVSGAGDVNGDGYDDVIIGWNSVNLNGDGKAQIFFGGPSMDTIADVTMYEQQNYTRFGQSLSDAGDVNHDGYDDVIIGDMDYNGTGRAYIYYGGANMNNEVDLILYSDNSYSQFGYCFDASGDINGDGYFDLVVGARSYGSGLGRAYIYYGSASMDNNADLILQGQVSGEEFGSDVALGDVNGDGYSDVICGAPFYNTYTGRVFLFYGSASVNNVADKIFTGDTTNGYFGAYLTCADFNNDGYDDIVTNSITSYFGGKVNFYYGNQNMSTGSQFSLRGGPYFGRSVESVKDFNGDHVPDLAISQSNDADYVFIFFSRPEGNSKISFYGAIQGMYDPVTDTEIPDTITVILRKNTPPYDIVDSAKNILLGPSSGQDFYFGKVHNIVPYYVEVRHRNALDTWSANPVMFSYQQTSIAFSVDEIYAYGNNEIQVDASPYNVFAFYSGDVNQDGYIDLTDVLAIYNGANNFLTGYVVTDLTGDSIVDLTDILMAYNNSAKFVSVIRP